MGHKSWGGARPNKWDREFHDESKPGRYAVKYDYDAKLWTVVDQCNDDEAVFSHKSIVHCEYECDSLNSTEEA